MFALIAAYAQGRGGVLDDRGRVIDTGVHAEWDPDEIDDSAFDEDAEFAQDDIEPRWKQVYGVAVAIGGFLITLLLLGMVVRWGWLLSGYIGHAIFGVPGVYGNAAGLVTGVGLILLFWLLSSRLKNAKRDLRARRGERNLVDCGSIYSLVKNDRCGACGFLIRNMETMDDGCVQCPECGAGWRRDWWEEYFLVGREGCYAELSKKHFRRFCMYDARDQIALIEARSTLEDRVASINEFRGFIGLRDVFILTLILLILLACLAGLLGVWTSFGNTTGAIITGGIGVVLIALIGWYAVRLCTAGVRLKCLQKYTRARIDDRVCPSCACDLGLETHPTDGALICDGCGLAWNPSTDRRRHHSRKRVLDDAFKNDPVFAHPLS